MKGSIVIINDLTLNDKSNRLSKRIYDILDDRNDLEVSILNYANNKKVANSKEYSNYRFIDNIEEIKNSIIVVFIEYRPFYKIDRSNNIVYITNDDYIENYLIYMLSRIDAIIAKDYKSAFKIATSVRQHELNTPVYRIPFHINNGIPSNGDKLEKILSIGSGSELNSLSRLGYGFDLLGSPGDFNFVNCNLLDKLPDDADYDLVICYDDNFDLITDFMSRGSIPVVMNKLPFNEFIIDGFNGYYFSIESDIASIIQGLMDQDHFLKVRGRSIEVFNYLFSIDKWSEFFIKTVNGIGADNINTNEFFVEVRKSARRWIVPKLMLGSGKTSQIPNKYDESIFRIARLSDLESILTFFVTQRFRDVFIFDWDYPDISDKNKILNLSYSIGRRGLNMYWCTDSNIPGEWSEVFSNMSILPFNEGLKKVKPPAKVLDKLLFENKNKVSQGD